MAAPTDKEIDEAWRDLARHPHWSVARLKLVRLLIGGIPRGLDDRVLREEVGRQSLARHLLDVTDSVSEEINGPERSPDERTYLVRPEPVSSARRGAVRRRTSVFPPDA
jgi:hypothetical protein